MQSIDLIGNLEGFSLSQVEFAYSTQTSSESENIGFTLGDTKRFIQFNTKSAIQPTFGENGVNLSTETTSSKISYFASSDIDDCPQFIGWEDCSKCSVNDEDSYSNQNTYIYPSEAFDTYSFSIAIISNRSSVNINKINTAE